MPACCAGVLRRVPMHLLFNGWVGLVHHYIINRDALSPGRSVLEQLGPALVAHYVSLHKKDNRW